jgi:hypothetical protein
MSRDEYGLTPPEEKKVETFGASNQEEQAAPPVPAVTEEAPDYTDRAVWIEVRRKAVRKLVESNGPTDLIRWVLTGETEYSHRKRTIEDGDKEFVWEPTVIPTTRGNEPEVLDPKESWWGHTLPRDPSIRSSEPRRGYVSRTVTGSRFANVSGDYRD